MTTFAGNPVTLEGKQLQPGDTLESFSIVLPDLSEYRPMDKKGKKIILSVPSVDTGVCSLELGKFRNLVSQQNDVEVVSVSMDLPFALDRWNKTEENETIITGSDFKNRDFAEKTGTRMAENGLLARAVFVTDEDGKLVHVEYVEEVATEPDYKKALEAAGIQA